MRALGGWWTITSCVGGCSTPGDICGGASTPGDICGGASTPGDICGGASTLLEDVGEARSTFGDSGMVVSVLGGGRGVAIVIGEPCRGCCQLGSVGIPPVSTDLKIWMVKIQKKKQSFILGINNIKSLYAYVLLKKYTNLSSKHLYPHPLFKNKLEIVYSLFVSYSSSG